jgi:aerobic carbon-monoxide dehydrogenase medium subunit
MTLPNYFAPSSIKEAVSLLSKYGEKAKVISGGTDLLRQMKHNEFPAECIVNIAGISELSYIKYAKSTGLRIGISTTMAELAASPLLQSKFNLLAQAAGSVGTPTIRNQATLGGNLCNAAPSADSAPSLLVLGAKAKIVGKKGEKIVPIEDFFKGPGQTMLGPGQLLTEIQIPNLAPRSGAVYLKEKRREGADIAVVGVAALVVLKGKVVSDVKIALGAVAPTPIRAKKAEAILKGNQLDEALLEKSSQAAFDEAKPISDIRSSADHRRRLVAVLTKRAVAQAVQQAEG